MSGEIKVLGMSHAPVNVSDIGYLISAGEIVAIPAEVALGSKDLWRAINQCQLQRVTSVTSTQLLEMDVQRLQGENNQLHEELAQLKANVARLEQALSVKPVSPDGSSEKLDTILALLSQQQTSAPQVAAPVRAKRAPSVVGGETPVFISASKIKPEGVESRVEIQQVEQEGSSVADASEALRRRGK